MHDERQLPETQPLSDDEVGFSTPLCKCKKVPGTNILARHTECPVHPPKDDDPEEMIVSG